MELKLQKIINKSLEENGGFSSSSHTSNTIMYESKEAATEEFVTPMRYYKNTLVLLPINQENYYAYWEITKELLEEFNLDLSQESLIFRVEDKNKKLLFEFDSSFDLGEYFFNLKVQNIDICVKVGFMRKSNFVLLLTSNTIRTFSSTILLPDVNSEIWLEKHKDYIKIIQINLENMVFNESSTSFNRQLKQLLYLNKDIITKSSSATLLGKNYD